VWNAYNGGLRHAAHQRAQALSDGATRTLTLAPRTVADFYGDLMATLRALDIDVVIRALPDEVENPIPFAEDDQHAAYDAEYAHRFWRILVQADRVFKVFRGRFVGKCSPVHFERFFAATFPAPSAPLALPELESEPDVIDVTPEPVEV
jgi:hypothetical protein